MKPIASSRAIRSESNRRCLHNVRCVCTQTPSAKIVRQGRDAAMAMCLLEFGQLGVHFIPARVAAAVPFEADRVETAGTFVIHFATLLRRGFP